MSDQSEIPLHARPDGEAELRLVLLLRWEDVAALGREAGRLAARLQRPVSLDEAASHRLRGRNGAHAAPPQARGQSAPAAVQPVGLSGRSSSPTEQAQEAIAKINRGAGASTPMPSATPEVRRIG